LTKGLVTVLVLDVVVVVVVASCVLPREKRAATRVRGEEAAGRDALAVLASKATRRTRKGKEWRVVRLCLGVVVVEDMQGEEEDAAPAAAAVG